MAKILFTAFMADARGKVAGTVFSKNRSGAYTRTKVTPVNRRTAAQSLQRQQLGSLSSSWRQLTQAQRDEWNSSVGNFSRTDIFGNVRNMTGQQLFVSLNQNLLNAGQATIQNAPTPKGTPTFELFDANVSTDVGDATYSIWFTIKGTLPAGYSMLVFATPPMSAGRDYFSNFKLLSPGAPTAPTVVSGNTQYNIVLPYYNIFGGPPLDTKVAFRAVLVNNATGEASAPLGFYAVTVAE